MLSKLNPEVIIDGSITVDKLNSNVAESFKTDSGFVTRDVLKKINGQSILENDISIPANVQAVDTGDVIDDVAVDYATKTYVDGLIGDVNSVLESIINS